MSGPAVPWSRVPVGAYVKHVVVPGVDELCGISSRRTSTHWGKPWAIRLLGPSTEVAPRRGS